MPNFWPKTSSPCLKKFERWSLTRELLKQYLTEKKKRLFTNSSITGGGHLREVVAMRGLAVNILSISSMLIHLYKANSNEEDIKCQDLMASMFTLSSLSKISSQAPKPYVNLTTDQIRTTCYKYSPRLKGSVMSVPVLFPTEREQALRLHINSQI